MKATDKAKSAAEFAKLIGAAAEQEAVRLHCSITTLTVEYNDNGYTVIVVGYEDGTYYVAIYPPGVS